MADFTDPHRSGTLTLEEHRRWEAKADRPLTESWFRFEAPLRGDEWTGKGPAD